MTSFEFKEQVGKGGIVTLQLPPEFEDDEVRITVEPVTSSETTYDKERPWTAEEIKALLNFQPVPAEEIVTGGWEDMGITD